MSSAIEETVKALVEFESELDGAKAEAAGARKRITKDTSDWVEAARASAISKAQEIASKSVAEAKQEAEAEADKIREKGASELKAFEGSISKRRSRAADLVALRLLGGSE